MTDEFFLFFWTVVICAVALVLGLIIREVKLWRYIRKHYPEEDEK